MPTTQTTPCPRCSGTGHLAQYAHVAGGRCFRCGRNLGPTLQRAYTDEERRNRAEGNLLGYLAGARRAAADGSLEEWAMAGRWDYVDTAAVVGSDLRFSGEAHRASMIAAFKSLPLPECWWDRARASWRKAAAEATRRAA